MIFNIVIGLVLMARIQIELAEFFYRRGRQEAAFDIIASYMHAPDSWPIAKSCAKIAACDSKRRTP